MSRESREGELIKSNKCKSQPCTVIESKKEIQTVKGKRIEDRRFDAKVKVAAVKSAGHTDTCDVTSYQKL